MKEEVDALPEHDNYEPCHEYDFMFLFSDDKHENMTFQLNYTNQSIQELIHSLCVKKRKDTCMIS